MWILHRIWQAHEQHQADATLLLHPNDHPLDSDLVEANAELARDRPFTIARTRKASGVKTSSMPGFMFWKKPRSPSDLVHHPPTRTLLDFGKDLFPAHAPTRSKSARLQFARNISRTSAPRSVTIASAANSPPASCRSSFATPQRAVFLDRDGTLVPDKDCLRTADGLELLPGVADALHRLNHSGWRAVLVTNQPVVAKGFCTEPNCKTSITSSKPCSDANTPFSIAFICARIIPRRDFPANGWT